MHTTFFHKSQLNKIIILKLILLPHNIRIILILIGDGCIFVWRLPQEMTANMLARLAQLGQPAKSRAYISGQVPPVQPEFTDPSEGIPSGPIVGNENDYRFSIGKLPVWAKKQIFERAGSLTPPSPPPTALQKG